MAFTFQGTKIANITVVNANGTSTSLTQLKFGDTKVWGKRSFSLKLYNPNWMDVSYSYLDAGEYSKSGTLSSTSAAPEPHYFENIGYNQNITIAATPHEPSGGYIYSVDTSGGTFSPAGDTYLEITASRTPATCTLTVSTSNATVSGNSETYNYGDTYSITISASSGYYFSTYSGGGSTTGSDAITVNTESKYQTLTITGTITSNITISATTVKYYTFTYGGSNNRCYGSLKYDNDKTTTIASNAASAILQSSTTVKYSGTLSISIGYVSQALYTSGSVSYGSVTYYGFGADDRLITAITNDTGINPNTQTISNWIGSGTVYNKVYMTNQSLSGKSASFYITMSDSARRVIKAPSTCAINVSTGSYAVDIAAGASNIFFAPYSSRSSTLSITTSSTSYYLSPTSVDYVDSSASDTTTVTATAKTGTDFSLVSTTSLVMCDYYEDEEGSEIFYTKCQLGMTVNQAYYVRITVAGTKVATYSIPYVASPTGTTNISRYYSVSSTSNWTVDDAYTIRYGQSTPQYSTAKIWMRMTDQDGSQYNCEGSSYKVEISTVSNFSTVTGYTKTYTGICDMA